MRGLLAITMAAVFFLLPLLCYLATAVFVTAYLRRRRRLAVSPRWADLRPVVREPLRVATILFLSGIAVVALIGGDLALENYASPAVAAVDVLGDAFTNWNDPLSSRAIVVRGGVFIVLLSCIFVTVALVSYFRNRWISMRDSSNGLTH